MRASPEQLNEFCGAIDGMIAAAEPEFGNNGNLVWPYNRDNWRTATFHTKAPELSSVVRPHTPFQPGDTVTASLRHYFDPRGNDDFVYWVHPGEGEVAYDEQGSAVNLSVAGWLRGGDDTFFIQGADRAIDLTEADFADLSISLLHERIPDIGTMLGQMPIRDALTLAVLRLREQRLSQKLTKDVAVKTFANSASANGFHLDVARFASEVEGDNGSYSLASIALRCSFYLGTEEAPHRGMLQKSITVKQQDGHPTTATKKAKVSMMNNPCISPDGVLGAYGNTHANDLAPESLRHLLFTDDEVTLGDVAYFTRLATEPLTSDDTEIAPKNSP